MGVERIKSHRALLNEQSSVSSTVAKNYFGLRNMQNNPSVIKCGRLGRILKPVVMKPETWEMTQLEPVKNQLQATVLPVLASVYSEDQSTVNKHIQSILAFNGLIRNRLQEISARQNRIQAEMHLCRSAPVSVANGEVISKSTNPISVEDLTEETALMDELLAKLQKRVINLEKIPVEPGFEFSLRNITLVLKRKEAESEKIRQLVTQLSSLA